MAETYREKEQRVLQKLYERDRRRTNPHGPIELARDLNIDYQDILEILAELENKGLADGVDQASWISTAGINFIESGGQQARGAVPGISFTTNIHGDNYGGVQQGGQGNTQNIMVTNNQPIGEILPKLSELINALRQVDFPDKEEVVQELEKVQALAEGEQNEGTWKRIQSRLNVAKTSMEIVGFAYKTLPYWPMIWDYFHSR